MKKILFLSLLALLLGFSSPFQSGKELLTHNKVNIKDDYIGYPGQIIFFDDGFIGIEYDRNSPPLFYFIKNNHQFTSTHIGNRGQGPNSITYVDNIQYLRKDIIGVFERNLSSYKEIFIYNNNTNNQKSVKFEGTYFKVLKLNHNQFVGLSSDSGMFHLVDSMGKIMNVFFEYPFRDKNEQSTSNSTRAMSYQGKIVVNPQKNKLIYTTNFGEIIHFYSIEKDQIKLNSKIENDYPIYEKIIINNNPITKLDFKKTTIGYISLDASDKYLYALYCGKKMDELMAGMVMNNIGNQVRIFDLNGKLIRILQLDVPCMQICISSDEKRIWALALIPEATLVYFDLE